MPLEKTWLRIAAGAVAGGILAFAIAALVSLATGSSPRTPSLVVAPKSPYPLPHQSAQPSPPSRPAPPLHEARKVQQPLDQVTGPPKVELREFKHVLVQPASYMNAPQGRVQLLSREFAWEPIGEIPPGELFRFEQSLLTLDKRLLRQVQRTNGSHVVLLDNGRLFRECWRQEVSPDTRQLADTRNAFAWDLYDQYQEEPGNLFFSPSSIAEALSMVLAGARGETAAEIKRALKLDKGPADVHATAASLRKLLLQRDPHRGFELLIANRAWAQQDITIEQPFTALLDQHYGAEMGLADFEKHDEAARQEINAWISEQTKGLLKNLVSEQDVNRATRLVLANAVYFFGEWDVPFEKELTKDEPFFLGDKGQKLVPMMNRRAPLSYYHGNGFQAVSIPYGKGQLAMVVIIPDDVSGLADIEATLTRQTVDHVIAGMKSHEVELALPRLEMKSRLDLVPVLKNLGIEQAFDIGRANFSGMHIPNPRVAGDNLFIQSAIHEAIVMVDEVGTVAAAATAIGMTAGVAPAPPPKVRADRPFVFLIRDQLTGSILFMGRVADPK